MTFMWFCLAVMVAVACIALYEGLDGDDVEKWFNKRSLLHMHKKIKKGNLVPLLNQVKRGKYRFEDLYCGGSYRVQTTVDSLAYAYHLVFCKLQYLQKQHHVSTSESGLHALIDYELELCALLDYMVKNTHQYSSLIPAPAMIGLGLLTEREFEYFHQLAMF